MRRKEERSEVGRREEGGVGVKREEGWSEERGRG